MFGARRPVGGFVRLPQALIALALLAATLAPVTFAPSEAGAADRWRELPLRSVWDVNNAGWAVGKADSNTEFSLVNVYTGEHRQVRPFGRQWAEVTAGTVTDGGLVLGSVSEDTSIASYSSFVYDMATGSATAVAPPDDYHTISLSDLNERGVAIGAAHWYSPSGSGASRSVIRHTATGETHFADDLLGREGIQATAINDDNVVLLDRGNQVVAWDLDRSRILAELRPPAGYEGLEFFDLNNAGTAVGRAVRFPPEGGWSISRPVYASLTDPTIRFVPHTAEGDSVADLNSANIVVGSRGTATGDFFAVDLDTGGLDAAGPPAGLDRKLQTNAINDHGEVVALTSKDATLGPSFVLTTTLESNHYEANGPTGTIYRLYRAYFLREPDKGGFAYWMDVYRRGYPLTDISQNFTRSGEFQSTYGSVSNRQFVELVYRNVLGRTPDRGGYDYWLDQMNNRGMPRGVVMINFSDSAEFRSKTADGRPPGY